MSAARKKRTAIGYVRVSVDRDDKVSPEMQRRAIEDYCERKGWPLVDVEIERGRSAGRGKARPGFDAVLDRIAAGEADTLLVYRLDRMTRSTIDFAAIRRHLEDAGAEFVSVTENLDTTTAMGRAMVGIVAVFAELERDTIADRVRDTNRQKRLDGRGPNGVAPYGYRHDEGGRLVVEPVEAEWLAQMAGWLLAGDSLRAISARLTEQGAPTPRRSNGRWNHGAVRSLLLNRHVIGEREDPPGSGQWVAAPWDAVLDADTFVAVESTLTDPARRTSHAKRRHLLSGLALCGRCGARLYPHTRAGTRRYRCIRSDKEPDACQGITVHADRLESVVVETTLDALAGIDTSVPQPATEDAEALHADLDDLAAAFGRGDVTMSEWRTARAGLVARLEAVEADQRTPRGAALVALAAEVDIAEAWERIGLDAQRAVLRDLWAAITVGPALADKRDVARRVTMTVEA